MNKPTIGIRASMSDPMVADGGVQSIQSPNFRLPQKCRTHGGYVLGKCMSNSAKRSNHGRSGMLSC